MRTLSLLPALLLLGCAASPDAGHDDNGVSAAETFDEGNQPKLPGVTMETRFSELPLSGTPAHEPWTGWWWPFEHQQNDERNGIAYAWNGPTSSPAEKLDLALGRTGKKSVTAWELANHAGGTTTWAGHCDGWSLASAVMPEPLAAVEQNGVCFQATDVKALLTEAFECDMSGQQVSLLGVECGEEVPERDADGRYSHAECRDVNPGTFHLTLANVIGLQHRGFFMDHYTEEQIWNYPIRTYASTADAPRAPTEDERRHSPRAAQVVSVKTTIEYVKELTPSLERNYDKTEAAYAYLLELDARGRIIGGEWLGDSISDHPDALKVPDVDAQPQHTPYECNNPNVDFPTVLELARRSATSAAECE